MGESGGKLWKIWDKIWNKIRAKIVEKWGKFWGKIEQKVWKSGKSNASILISIGWLVQIYKNEFDFNA